MSVQGLGLCPVPSGHLSTSPTVSQLALKGPCLLSGQRCQEQSSAGPDRWPRPCSVPGTAHLAQPCQGPASWLPWILKPCWGAAEQGCSCPAQSLHCPWSRSSEQSSRVGSAWPRAICQSLHRLALPPSLAGCWRGLLGTAVPAGLRHGHSSAAHHGTGTQSDSHHQHQPAQAAPTSPGKSQGTVPAENRDLGSVLLRQETLSHNPKQRASYYHGITE